MAIDKNTTQINNFSKGMNTDTSDMYLEDGSYRLARNLRYITNTGENSGELHIIEGAKYLASVTGEIIATTQLREWGLIVTQTTDGWNVYKIQNGSNEVKLVVSIHSKDRVYGTKPSLVTRWEDEANQKLYIADGKGPIISIQLDLINGGNIITDLSKSIAYPEVTLSPPRFCGLIYGNLKSGMYEYSYQYYVKHGPQTEISPSTKLIPLHDGSLTVKDSNSIKGYEEDFQTNKGIKIDIKLDNLYLNDKIRIFRIHYNQVGQLPDIDIIYDGDIETNGESQYMEFSDVGNEAISVLSLEEYNSISGIHIIPKTIESLYDYMFASNIQNDNPIYNIEGIDQVHVEYEFIQKELIGDTCEDEDKQRITIGTNLKEDQIEDEFQQSDFPSEFVGELTDKNKTYANPFVSYSYKSLRRGERYRYGIVMYDKFGNATAVKHIADIDVPSFNAENYHKPFEFVDGKLKVWPMGIRFTVTNIPQDIVAYEIVRCGRSASDVSIVTQCVLSRPIVKPYAKVEDISSPTQTFTYPLTPTGWVTIMDAWYGGEDSRAGTFPHMYSPLNQYGASTGFWSTNSSLTPCSFSEDGKIKGNHSIFQVISPEYCYEEDTVKDMLAKQKLVIEPIMYLTPEKIEPFQKISINPVVESICRGDRQYYNIGNKFANIRIESKGSNIMDIAEEHEIDRAIVMDMSIDNVMCFYEIGENGEPRDFYDTGEEFAFKYSTMANRFAYIKLYDAKTTTKETEDITSVAFPEQLDWNDFGDVKEEWVSSYQNKVTAISGKNFCNWVCGGLIGATKDQGLHTWSNENTDGERINQYNNVSLDNEASAAGQIMGPGGKCALISVNGTELSEEEANSPIMGTYLCNIKKTSAPYGGDPRYSTYRSYGNYFHKDVVNVVDIYDGDCFIMPFEYVSCHKAYFPYLSYMRNMMIAYSIPMETSVNLAYTHGYELSKHAESAKGDISNIQVNPSNVNNTFIQDTPLYAYNSIYSATSTARTLIAEDSEDEDFFDSKYDFRTYNSLTKSNDENIDSWLKFQASNYIDVDTRYGEITGLRKFNNSLIFWQENAAGILAVNERTQITDESNMPLILGTAGVLSRYDYMNTSNGMREGEYADTQSDTTLYWWDHNKHEIIGYSGGTQTVSISKAKFIQNLLNDLAQNDKLSNKPTLAYDKMFNEVLFKVSNSDTIVFSENTGSFTSLYDINPSGAITFKNKTILTSGSFVYDWNVLDGKVKGFNKAITPYLKYIVNQSSTYTKVFDNSEFAGRFYGGGISRTYVDSNPLKNLTFKFSTPLKQQSTITGDKIDNTEYNFRFAIPRNNGSAYGDRMRGKTMQAELTSSSSDYDFSLQYIITKYRISWT